MQKGYVPYSKQIEVHPSPVARRLLWHPYSMGTIYLERPDHHEPFEKPGVHLFWVVAGQGRLQTQGHDYALKPGNSVWFIDMMHRRTYFPQAGRKLTIRGIRFGGPGLESWHEQLGGGNKAEFVSRDVGGVRYAYRELWQIVRRKPAAWEWSAHLVLTRILGLLLTSRNLLSPSRLEMPAPIARVFNAIGSNPFRDWKAKDLPPIAGVSYSGLRALFQETQHESLHAFLQRTRMDQARLLLSDSQLTIKQVAEQLNFSSAFYFSHFFRNWAKMSPTEFRKQLQGPRRKLES